MSISKSARFEVFKRDGFTCQYCGQRPPDVVLEVDHIDPRAGGGSDEFINLITSCFDCNRGKAAKKLGNIRPWPDADVKSLEVQQEIAEAQRFLKAQAELHQVRVQVKHHLISIWTELLDEDYIPTDKQWQAWLAKFSAEEIEFAMRRTAPKFQGGYFGKWNTESMCQQAIRYVSGILYRRREESEPLCPSVS